MVQPDFSAISLASQIRLWLTIAHDYKLYLLAYLSNDNAICYEVLSGEKDRHTDTLIAILHNPAWDEVNMAHGK